MSHMPDSKRKCPRTGFTKSCRDLVLKEVCQDRWVDIVVKNTQTGTQAERWGCVDDLALQVQMSIEARLLGVQAATEIRGDTTNKLLVDGMMRQERQHREAIGVADSRAQAAQQLTGPGQMDLIALIDSEKAN